VPEAECRSRRAGTIRAAQGRACHTSSRAAWYNPPVGWDQVATILITVVLAVLAGTFYNNRRIDDVSRRFDDVSRRFDDVHRRIDDLRADMNARFVQVETQLRELRQELQTTRQELVEQMRETRTLLQEALKARTS
jgi:Skp family chaperone for outer membrane proteins